MINYDYYNVLLLTIACLLTPYFHILVLYHSFTVSLYYIIVTVDFLLANCGFFIVLSIFLVPVYSVYSI